MITASWFDTNAALMPDPTGAHFHACEAGHCRHPRTDRPSLIECDRDDCNGPYQLHAGAPVLAVWQTRIWICEECREQIEDARSGEDARRYARCA